MHSPFASSRALFGSLAVAAVAVVGVTSLVAGTSSAGPHGGAQVRMLDQCDPVTFNAPKPAGLGPGSCVGSGEVTLQEVGASVATTGGHPDWRFKDSMVSLTAGRSLLVQNRGGEGHTFTEVQAFGLGAVPQLNTPFMGTTAAVPVGVSAGVDFSIPPTWGVIAPGGSTTITGLAVGTHRFQCIIHPWMRTVVTVTSGS